MLLLKSSEMQEVKENQNQNATLLGRIAPQQHNYAACHYMKNEIMDVQIAEFGLHVG